MSLHSNVHPLVSCQSPRVNISWFMNYLVLRNGNDQCLTSEASIFEDAIIWLGTESGFLFQYSAGKSSNIHLSKFAPSPQISTHTALFSRLKSALQRIFSLKKATNWTADARSSRNSEYVCSGCQESRRFFIVNFSEMIVSDETEVEQIT